MKSQRHICTCPTCGHKHNTSEREIALFSGLVKTLIRVYIWCKKNNRTVFQRKEIKHLIKSDNEIARFGDWEYFGSLVYKDGTKGRFGLNMESVREFIAGERKIPTKVWKDPVTQSLTESDLKYISEIPNLSSFLDENDMYIAKYRNAEQNKTMDKGSIQTDFTSNW